MKHIGIVGASGYGGAETLRFLLNRPDVSVDIVTASSSVGQRVDALYPSLAGRTSLVYKEFDPAALAGLDVVFVSLPSGEGMKAIPPLHENVGRIIDLGGDFRLQSPSLYQQYYKHTHTASILLAEAVYGLPELSRAKIAAARLVANPGCYATSVLLALLPALTGGFVEPTGIVINSLSGTSGAGRSSAVDMSFTELNESVRAYKVGVHQHIPEIETVLAGATGVDVSVSFIPHLLPITRGIYTTIHATMARTATQDAVAQAFREYYRHAPFVRIVHHPPSIAAVTRTNFCDVFVHVQERTNQMIIMSTIDNLLKGAAGQAIQNMNIMLGEPETTGLMA